MGLSCFISQGICLLKTVYFNNNIIRSSVYDLACYRSHYLSPSLSQFQWGLVRLTSFEKLLQVFTYRQLVSNSQTLLSGASLFVCHLSLSLQGKLKPLWHVQWRRETLNAEKQVFISLRENYMFAAFSLVGKSLSIQGFELNTFYFQALFYFIRCSVIMIIIGQIFR